MRSWRSWPPTACAPTVGIAPVVLAGCLHDLGPEVGEPVHDTCDDVDSDPDTDVGFTTGVLPILEGTGRCTTCHTPTGKTPFGLDTSNLDLSTRETLLAGGTRSGVQIVVAGHPCASVLVQKLGQSPPFGARMPLDAPPFLTADELQRIADWIAEGAQ